MKTQNQKGKELEQAVKAIEEAILTRCPEFLKRKFVIESNKIISSEGVRHEIDIYVSLPAEFGYGSTFIFECKNRKAKANKSDLIIFSEKVAATNAQGGFFIAKSFTADAVAQAKKDKRIELLHLKDIDPAQVLAPKTFLYGVSVGRPNVEIIFHNKTEESAEVLVPVDLQAMELFIDGKKTDPISYFDVWSAEVKNATVYGPSVNYEMVGTQVVEFFSKRTFKDRGAIANGECVARIELKGKVEVQVYGSVVETIYEVEKRGRTYNVRLDAGDVQVRAQFVEVLQAKQKIVQG